MELSELPPAIQKIASLGPILWNKDEWTDYRAHGIGPEHIPTLIEIIEHASDFWEDNEDAELDPIGYLPVHAWRALGQMQAKEAVPALLNLLRLIDEEESDLIQGELPDVFGAMGPVAVPEVSAYMLEVGNDLWGRITAADGLRNIGNKYPETRAEVVKNLMQALALELEITPTASSMYNAFLIIFLESLKAVEAAPLVEQAFKAERVDDTISGDWEDFQVDVGLLEQRLTPSKHRMGESLAFSEGLPNLEDIQKRARTGREDKKTKSQRKQAKASRQKNRQKSHKKKKK